MSAQMSPGDLVAWHAKVSAQRDERMTNKTGNRIQTACPIGCEYCTVPCMVATALLHGIEAQMREQGIAPATSATLH